MKKCVSRSEVAHIWAHQLQDEAWESGKRFYFEGKTIYSYGPHFPIATIHNDVVLFTTRTYSNTTTKHIYEARSAVSHMEKIYCYDPKEASINVHSGNIQAFINRIKAIHPNLLKARKPEKYLSEIGYIKSQLERYLDVFSLKLTKEQKAIVDVSNKDEYNKLAGKIEKARREREAKIKKLGRPVYERYKAAWHNNEEREFMKALPDIEKAALNTYRYNQDEETWLRIEKWSDGTRLATSKGIHLALDVAKRYFRFYERIVAKGGCNGNCNYKMLDYEVKAANRDFLVIGCHNIPASEIYAIAEALEWITVQA
jgi:predicted  nucleic acid-binding Zn-ribbon protein